MKLPYVNQNGTPIGGTFHCNYMPKAQQNDDLLNVPNQKGSPNPAGSWTQ